LRAVVAFQHVHARYAQAEDVRGVNGCALVLGRELDWRRDSAAMYVAAELTRTLRLPRLLAVSHGLQTCYAKRGKFRILLVRSPAESTLLIVTTISYAAGAVMNVQAPKSGSNR